LLDMNIGMTIPQQAALEATLAGFEQAEALGFIASGSLSRLAGSMR
jgi:hypothetical protein